MKKIVLGACLLLGVTFAANATNRTSTIIVTSCGTAYEASCNGCSALDLVNAALILDAIDCG
ncbi:hypothetical protein [Pedobacter sp. UYP1]|jgi:hypothetical protein|uniref:hypothetical protein n=1 Tax=Pedobacter sp. UYP1 TaxID=1756396 RepID=UPI0033972A54